MSSTINEVQFTQSGEASMEVIWQDSDQVPITTITYAEMQLKINKTDKR